MLASQRDIQRVLHEHFSESSGWADISQAMASVAWLFGVGGDRRIWPDPTTRRNRYGTLATPVPGEVAFASTTASNVSEAGFLAADAELRRLFDMASPYPVGFEQWFAEIRSGIAKNLGCADSEIILAASGTDAELLAAALFVGLSARPLTNILVAPDETGSGVLLAAGGRHYSDTTALGATVESGRLIDGIKSGDIDVVTISVRNDRAEARSQQEIDAELIAVVERELGRGRDVLLHVLDTSKTGLTGVSRQMARQAVALAPGRVHVLVDACQFRCSMTDIRQDIADGFMVAVTGSKFIAGPPFSGALLVPSALVEAFAASSSIPGGLSDYTAAQDWPSALRERLAFEFTSEFNLGLGLRWIAALANLSAYAAIDPISQLRIKQVFAKQVSLRIENTDGASLHSQDDGEHLVSRAIIPLTLTKPSGEFFTFEETQAVQLLLRTFEEGPVCHIGQAVRLGNRSVLRIAASATDIAAVATGLAAGQALQSAMRPVEQRLDIIFDKLSAVLRHIRAM